MRSRSLLLTAPRRLEWIEEELPVPGQGEVLIRTRHGAISIGTELPLFRGDSRSSRPAGYPTMTGYESVGTVVATGPDTRLRVGDRVVATYGHRSHAVLREERTIPVPDSVHDEIALLAILSCDAARGVSKVDPAGDVLITGAGTMGLLTLHNLIAGARESGAGRRIAVDVVDPLAERRALALRLGARAAYTADAALRAGYSAGFECSGRNGAFRTLQRSLRPHGSICVLSDGNVEPLVLDPAFHERELHLVGSSDGLDYRAHAVWFYDAAGRDGDILRGLYGYRTTADRLPETFGLLGDWKIDPIKVLVDWETSED